MSTKREKRLRDRMNVHVVSIVSKLREAYGEKIAMEARQTMIQEYSETSNDKNYLERLSITDSLHCRIPIDSSEWEAVRHLHSIIVPGTQHNLSTSSFLTHGLHQSRESIIAAMLPVLSLYSGWSGDYNEARQLSSSNLHLSLLSPDLPLLDSVSNCPLFASISHFNKLALSGIREIGLPQQWNANNNVIMERFEALYHKDESLFPLLVILLIEMTSIDDLREALDIVEKEGFDTGRTPYLLLQDEMTMGNSRIGAITVVRNTCTKNKNLMKEWTSLSKKGHGFVPWRNAIRLTATDDRMRTIMEVYASLLGRSRFGGHDKLMEDPFKKMTEDWTMACLESSAELLLPEDAVTQELLDEAEEYPEELIRELVKAEVQSGNWSYPKAHGISGFASKMRYPRFFDRMINEK